MLEIFVKEGTLYRNTETFGKMDPFVTFEYAKKKYRTTVKDDAGQHPIWNERIYIVVKSLEDTVKVTCFDEDMLTDEEVGKNVYKVKTLLTNKADIRVNYKGKVAAKISYEAKIHQKQNGRFSVGGAAAL